MKCNAIIFFVAGLLYSGSINAQQTHTIAGANMEAWHDVSSSQNLNLEAPDGWYGSDELIAQLAPTAAIVGFVIDPKKQLFKTTDSHQDSLAAEVKTEFLGDSIGNMTGILSNAKIEVDVAALMASGGLNDPSQMLSYLSYSGGTDVTGQVDTVAAWVKCGSGNMDSAAVTVLMMKTVTNDSSVQVGGGSYLIPPSVTAYEKIAIPVTYSTSEIPDKLIVLFQSSSFSDTSKTVDNSLMVDGVTYSYGVTGIHEPLLQKNQLSVYPNPATTQVHFNLAASLDVSVSGFVLTVTDVSGSVITQQRLTQKNNLLEVGTWAPGVYFYALTEGTQAPVQAGQFSVR